MRPQAHVAASLLVWAAGPRPAWEAPVCVLAGNLPDLDRSVARRLGVTRRDHHRWVSHSLVGWIGPSAAAVGLARRGPGAGTWHRALACLWTHLLMDTYADGIAWLWPLSEKKVGLFRRPEGIVDRGWRTPAPLSTAVGRIEAAMWAGTLVLAVRPRGVA